MKILKQGDRGKEVLDIQSRLRSLGYNIGADGVDGLFGKETLTAILHFQQARGLLADGIVAENTWCELVETGYRHGERLLYLRVPPFRGDDVLELQRSLNLLGFNAGPEDGIYGQKTDKAVLDFQKNSGLIVDGMVDSSVLRSMSKVTKEGEPHAAEGKIPDRNGGYAGGRKLSETVIVIDAGHGGSDIGSTSASGVREKDLNLEVARGVAEMLDTDGSRIIMTREDDRDLSLYERTEVANLANADLFISIHQNNDKSSKAQGASAYYFSRQGYFSEAGRMLAQHIVDRMALELDVPALPTQGRNYAVLRETEMTAILAEPVFISDSKLGEKLQNPEFIQRQASAIYNGLVDYFSK